MAGDKNIHPHARFGASRKLGSREQRRAKIRHMERAMRKAGKAAARKKLKENK